MLNGAYSHFFLQLCHTLYAFWDKDRHHLNPLMTRDHLCHSIHLPFPSAVMPGQCKMWGRNRVGGMMECVACNYRSLAGPVAVMCNSQIKVQPVDSVGLTAALCYLIAGSWVSHVKWQAGKCEIPDKAQSPKNPWSSGNEESDGVWGLGMLSRQGAASSNSFYRSPFLLCSICERESRGEGVCIFYFSNPDLEGSTKLRQYRTGG